MKHPNEIIEMVAESGFVLSCNLLNKMTNTRKANGIKHFDIDFYVGFDPHQFSESKIREVFSKAADSYIKCLNRHDVDLVKDPMSIKSYFHTDENID